MKTNFFFIIFLFVCSSNVCSMEFDEINKTILTEHNTLIQSYAEKFDEGKILLDPFNGLAGYSKDVTSSYHSNSPVMNYGLNPVVAEVPESFFEKYSLFIVIFSIIASVILMKVLRLF